MNRALAVVWAQWRTYRNYTSRNSIWLGILIGLVWYGFWGAAGFGAAVVMAQPDVRNIVVALSGALLLMSMYWQFIPMMMAASGLALDLRRIKAYPIPTRELFTIEVLLRATAAMEMLIVLLGAAIGVMLNPSLPKWTALTLVPFAVFHMLLSLGIRDVVARVLAHRRMREITALLFVALITLPRLLFFRRPPTEGGSPGGRPNWLGDYLREARADTGPALLPWTSAANLFTDQDVLRSAVVLGGWCMLAGVFALWQFRRSLVFDVEEARSEGSAPVGKSPAWTERFFLLPSTLLRDPLGVMIEKELRYLSRAPRFRLLFLMGCALGVVIPRAIYRDGAPLWAPSYLTAASAYSLLILGEVCFWNTFGFDRSAAQIYFLTPVKFTQVLVAKNLTAAFWLTLQLLLMWGLGVALRTPMGIDQVAEAATFILVTVLLLWSIGNYTSVHNARPADPDSSMRARAAGGMQALLLFAYPLTFVPAGLAYFARWAFHTQWAFYGVMTVMAALAAMVYTVALEATAAMADREKEAMVTALSARQGPIAS